MAKTLTPTTALRRSASRSRVISTNSSARSSELPRAASRAPGTRILVVADTTAQRGRLARGVAAELNRDLFPVELGEVVGKYIGETEKNLRTLFADAEEKGSILFFDEADALFGRRTTVKDSHDRFANLETSYLLEQIERSGALVLLATHSPRKIDPAAMKRLRFGLKITLPDSSKR